MPLVYARRGLQLSLVFAASLLAAMVATSVRASVAYATPEDVVQAFVEEHGELYAGECPGTEEQIGYICSKLFGSVGDIQAYGIGRTRSEFTWCVYARLTQEGWVYAGDGPFNFFGQTPEEVCPINEPEI